MRRRRARSPEAPKMTRQHGSAGAAVVAERFVFMGEGLSVQGDRAQCVCRSLCAWPTGFSPQMSASDANETVHTNGFLVSRRNQEPSAGGPASAGLARAAPPRPASLRAVPLQRRNHLLHDSSEMPRQIAMPRSQATGLEHEHAGNNFSAHEQRLILGVALHPAEAAAYRFRWQ
jgi:hypothetical protein